MTGTVRETALRDALRDVADRGNVPAGLADGALRQARRRGRTRSVGLVCVLALIAVLGAVAVAGPIGPIADRAVVAPDRATAGAPAEQRVVASYRDPASGLYHLLDRRTGRYQPLPVGWTPLPSDDGQETVVIAPATAGDASATPDARVGIRDPGTGAVRWSAPIGLVVTVSWTRDRSRLIVLSHEQNSAGGAEAVVLVDARSLALTRVPIRSAGDRMLGFPFPTPDGRGYARSTVAAAGGSTPQVGRLEVYALDGRLLRRSPLTTWIRRDPFDPSGTLMATDTGVVSWPELREVRRLPGLGPDDGVLRLGWHDSSALVVGRFVGPVVGGPLDRECRVVVLGLDGRERPGPDGDFPSCAGMTVTSAAGLSPAAGGLAF